MTPPEWRHLDERAIEQLRAAGIATAWEKEYLRKDGSRIPVLVGVAMLEGTAGEVIAFILDLTERKRAEAAVRSSEERFRRLTESGIVGIVLAETSGKIHEANDAFLKMVGYTREDLAAGRIRSSDLNPSDWKGVQDGARRQLTTQGIAHPWEKEFIRKDGSRVPVLIAVTMLDPPNCLNIILDLSEQKRAEAANRRLREQQEEIVEANRMKGQFLANMSHELRTPLNAIIGFAELMHSGKVGPLAADHHEYLGDILTSSRHLLQLINDILDLAKVESGKMEFRPERVDLGKLVGEVRDILRGLAAEKRLNVATQIDPQAGTAFIDPARVKQVLYNYLSNAIKFTSEGGLVTARIIAQETALFRLEVEDSGIGISAEDIDKLFVEFHQLDASSAKRFQGTGLGLAMTKRIVEALGGRVEVRSTPGKGSTFSAVLPRGASEPSLVEV
jgi:PAS domain S-box-containing protein